MAAAALPAVVQAAGAEAAAVVLVVVPAVVGAGAAVAPAVVEIKFHLSLLPRKHARSRLVSSHCCTYRAEIGPPLAHIDIFTGPPVSVIEI